MTHLTDLRAAITDYPNENVVISVTDFLVQTPPHISKEENASFNVRVENNGQLDMRNVKLHIFGSDFASVTQTNILGTPINFSNSLISSPRNIDAHASTTFGGFYMHAREATPGEDQRDIFSVHISTWDASLDHILRDHSGHSPDVVRQYPRHIHEQ